MLYHSRFAILSILLHGLVFYALFHTFRPYEPPKPEAIKSYLLIKTPKPQESPNQVQETPTEKEKISVEQPSNTPDTSDTNADPQASSPKEPAVPKEVTLPKQEVVKVTQTEDKINTIDIAPKLNADNTSSSPSSLRGVSSYIQNLHQVELERLSEGALRQYKEPKALGNKASEPNRNKELREASTSYAPKEANIIVLSEFGPNEKTILMNRKCITVPTTELDDPFWKGPKLWTTGNGCGKYDKFNGQLQKSLDKHLKK